MRLDALIVAKRTAEKNVRPSRGVQGGNCDVAEMLLDRNALPVIVVARMIQPVQKISCERSCRSDIVGHIEQWITGQRQLPHPDGGIGAFADGVRESVLRQSRGP